MRLRQLWRAQRRLSFGATLHRNSSTAGVSLEVAAEPHSIASKLPRQSWATLREVKEVPQVQKKREELKGQKALKTKLSWLLWWTWNLILDFSRSFSAASEARWFAAPPTTGKRTGARLLGTNALCLWYSSTHLILAAGYLSWVQLEQSELPQKPTIAGVGLESNARAQCYQNPDATFMVHISTAQPGGPLPQQVQRNSSSTGILAAATDLFCRNQQVSFC